MTRMKSVNWENVTILSNGLASDIPCIMQAVTRRIRMRPQPRYCKRVPAVQNGSEGW